MIKDFFTDIAKDLLKAAAGLIIPVSMVLVGTGLVALSFKFEMEILLWLGGVVALCGLIWGAILLLWHSGA